MNVSGRVHTLARGALRPAGRVAPLLVTPISRDGHCVYQIVEGVVSFLSHMEISKRFCHGGKKEKEKSNWLRFLANTAAIQK